MNPASKTYTSEAYFVISFSVNITCEKILMNNYSYEQIYPNAESQGNERLKIYVRNK